MRHISQIIPFVIAVLVLSASAALARPPDSSLRPVMRGQGDYGVLVRLVRPKARTHLVSAIAAHRTSSPIRAEPAQTQPDPRIIRAALAVAVQEPSGLGRSLRPVLRPRRIERKASARNRALAKGAVCGDPALQGEVVGRVPGKLRGCGVNQAIRLRSVDGIPLSRASTMDCRTAKAVKTWVQRGPRRAIGSYGGGLAELHVVAHYSCRTRNNRPGAKISEHGKGRAIDIAGFGLRDGSEISVLRDWGRGKKGRILKRIQAQACGPFGTVLGPNADRYHRDHFHFDTARHRSGPYCR